MENFVTMFSLYIFNSAIKFAKLRQTPGSGAADQKDRHHASTSRRAFVQIIVFNFN